MIYYNANVSNVEFPGKALLLKATVRIKAWVRDLPRGHIECLSTCGDPCLKKRRCDPHGLHNPMRQHPLKNTMRPRPPKKLSWISMVVHGEPWISKKGKKGVNNMWSRFVFEGQKGCSQNVVPMCFRKGKKGVNKMWSRFVFEGQKGC